MLHPVPERFHAVKKAAFVGGVRLRATFLELAQQLFLLRIQLDRRFNRHLDIHVTAGCAADGGHTLSTQAHLTAGLCAFRTAHAAASAIDRRHLYFSAESSGDQRDRDLAEQIHAFALE